jgi:phage terminase large subunit GpA-like protein
MTLHEDYVLPYYTWHTRISEDLIDAKQWKPKCELNNKALRTIRYATTLRLLRRPLTTADVRRIREYSGRDNSRAEYPETTVASSEEGAPKRENSLANWTARIHLYISCK